VTEPSGTATEPEHVPIRDAATVALLRDTAAGLETWLLTRAHGMVFAGGNAVFPGGRVEASDGDVPWAGRPATDFAELFGCSEPVARALVGAAVRETYEEAGVLLTVPAAALPDERAAVEAGRTAFPALLRRHGLAVDADELHPWSRWITPEGMTRRYDTRFFLAELPDAATAHALTPEAVSAGWFGVADAVDAAETGRLRMLPPTYATLASLRPYRKVADVLATAAGRSMEPVRGRIRRHAGRPAIEFPDGSVLPLPPEPAP
jgi:8-oxo-dGTP pyrophosphatase MutT (NUDIX family)